jgi:hypothetical protein
VVTAIGPTGGAFDGDGIGGIRAVVTYALVSITVKMVMSTERSTSRAVHFSMSDTTPRTGTSTSKLSAGLCRRTEHARDQISTRAQRGTRSAPVRSVGHDQHPCAHTLMGLSLAEDTGRRWYD